MVFSHKSAVVEILVFSKIVRSRWRKWSKIEVEKMVLFFQMEKMGSPVLNHLKHINEIPIENIKRPQRYALYYKRSDAHFDLDPRDIWADAANDLYNYEDTY